MDFYTHSPLAKSFISDVRLVNVNMGIRANGSCSTQRAWDQKICWSSAAPQRRHTWHKCTCMLCSTFRKSFMPVRCWTSSKTATRRVGNMAMERVNNTRAKRDQRRFRKPWKSQSGTGFKHAQISCYSLNQTFWKSTYLHHKLTRVGSCHGWTLSSSEDPNGPNIECSRAKKTAQNYALQAHTQKKFYSFTSTQSSYLIEYNIAVMILIKWFKSQKLN